MSYLPRPDAARTQQDVDEIYLLTVEALQKTKNSSAQERREVFRQALLRAYEGGVDAQRDIVRTYEHTRPTPVPPPPDAPEEDDFDPGDLPAGSRLRTAPQGAFVPGKPPRRS